MYYLCFSSVLNKYIHTEYINTIQYKVMHAYKWVTLDDLKYITVWVDHMHACTYFDK